MELRGPFRRRDGRQDRQCGLQSDRGGKMKAGGWEPAAFSLVPLGDTGARLPPLYAPWGYCQREGVQCKTCGDLLAGNFQNTAVPHESCPWCSCDPFHLPCASYSFGGAGKKRPVCGGECAVFSRLCEHVSHRRFTRTAATFYRNEIRDRRIPRILSYSSARGR